MPLIKRSSPAPDVTPDVAPSLEALVADLHAGDPAQRRSAARALADVPAAVSALIEVVATEPLAAVREAIFTSLIRLGTEDVAAGLLPLLQSDDVNLRNGAIEVLKTLPEAVAEQIEGVFGGDTDLRIFGVEIVGALAHPAGPRRLIRIIEEDPAINVCAAAVDALTECGDREAIAPLRRLLKRFPNEPFLEFSVRTALARIANG